MWMSAGRDLTVTVTLFAPTLKEATNATASLDTAAMARDAEVCSSFICVDGLMGQ